MKISTATKQGSPSCKFPGSQPLSPSQCPPWLPVGIACTSTLPISNPIAAPCDRKGTSLAPSTMRIGLLALDPSTFLFGIAFTARCKAMLFIAPLRFASAAVGSAYPKILPLYLYERLIGKTTKFLCTFRTYKCITPCKEQAYNLHHFLF